MCSLGRGGLLLPWHLFFYWDKGQDDHMVVCKVGRTFWMGFDLGLLL